MITSEKGLEKKLREQVTKAGGLAVKFTSPSMSGVPDRLILLAGKCWFVEVKSKGKKPTPIQTAAHGLFAKTGHAVWVVSSETELNELFKDMGI